MNKRTGILVLAAALLGATYVFLFTDLFQQKSIQIMYRSLPSRGGKPGVADPVTFYLDREYPITSIKVFRAAEIATNKYAHPLWHLIADTNAAPIADFSYGASIPGMKPAIPKAEPTPLAPHQSYQIVVQAGKYRGEREFQTKGAGPAR